MSSNLIASPRTTNAHEYLGAVLSVPDILIRREILQMRRRMRVSEADDIQSSEWHAVVISEHEVDALVNTPPLTDISPDPAERLTAAQCKVALATATERIAEMEARGQAQGEPLRFAELAKRFHLSAFELQVAVIALAPELDSKYERLYGYLQDDVNKKRPTVELALRLLCETAQQRLDTGHAFAHGLRSAGMIS